MTRTIRGLVGPSLCVALLARLRRLFGRRERLELRRPRRLRRHHTPAPSISKSRSVSLPEPSDVRRDGGRGGARRRLGYEAWLDEQLLRPASLELPHSRQLPVPQNIQELHRDRVDIWFRNAVTGPDQLRQRVAFALSEIMVVSQVGALAQPAVLGRPPTTICSRREASATSAT